MSDRPMTVGSRCAAALLFGLGLSAATSSASAEDGALTLYRSFNREFATTAVVYANERVLAIHVAGAKGHDGGDAVATQGGHDGGDAAFGYLRSVATQTVRLPRKAKRVTDLLTGETLAENADAFTADFATPDTRLFETEY